MNNERKEENEERDDKMIANSIDHTQYAMIEVDKAFYPYVNKVDDKTLVNHFMKFVPVNVVRRVVKLDPFIHRNSIRVSWSVICPVLKTLLKEDWYFKFENDEDSEALEYIQEEYDEIEERLNKIEQVFKHIYMYLLPDPMFHTRLIITPKDSQTDFIFYYGETVELQNNSVEDKYHLFRLIIERYYNVEKQVK